MKGEWDTEEAIRRWDMHAAEVASRYGSQGDRHREVLLNPVLLELLGSVQGRRILDAGCGEGYLSRILAERGASVVAVDYSRHMLDIARERTPAGLAIDYVYGNCEDLGFLKGGSFDVVVANMVLQDLSDYEAVIREMHRVLVPGGAFIFTIAHPCFTAPECGWVRDDEGEKLHWKVDRYFEEVVSEQDYPRGAKDRLLHFHRTLTSYFRAVREAGFAVEALVEPRPSEEMLSRYPEFRDDLRMCHFLAFKARKRRVTG